MSKEETFEEYIGDTMLCEIEHREIWNHQETKYKKEIEKLESLIGASGLKELNGCYVKIKKLETQIELLTKCETGRCGQLIEDYERFGKVQNCQGCKNTALIRV